MSVEPGGLPAFSNHTPYNNTTPQNTIVALLALAPFLNKKALVNARAHPRFSKFAKMVKMHIPLRSVLAKMRKEGMSEADRAAFESNTPMPLSAATAKPASGGSFLDSIKGFKKGKLKKSKAVN